MSNPSPSTAKRPNRPRRIILAVLAAAALFWAGRALLHLWLYESTDDAYVSGHIHQVSSQIGGEVAQVLVHENEAVKKGQVLVRLDPTQFDIGLQSAKAGFLRARAEVAQAEAAEYQARADLAQAHARSSQADAELKRAQAQFELARLTLERDRRMSSGDDRAVTPAELDAAQAGYGEAQAAVSAAQANVESMRASVSAAESEEKAASARKAAADAGIAAGEAAVRDAERRLSYVDIASPADGTVGAKSVEVGNRVQTGQTLLVVVEPEVWIEANFKETQLTRMHAGEAAEATIDALPGRVFPARIQSFAPASGAEFALLPPDNATGNFTKVVQRVPVRVVLDPAAVAAAGGRLRPGLSAVVEVRVR